MSLAFGGVYLAAPTASATPGYTTQITTSPVGVLQPGDQTTISLQVRQCDGFGDCYGPLQFYWDGLNPSMTNTTDLTVHSSADAVGVWRPVTLTAADVSNQPALATFTTPRLYQTTTYTFRMGGDAVSWIGTIDPPNQIPVVGADSAPVTVTVDGPNYSGSSLNFTVADSTPQTLTFDDLNGVYPTGSSLHIAEIPPTFDQVWNVSTSQLSITTTATEATNGTFTVEIWDNADPGDHAVLATYSVDYVVSLPAGGDPCAIDNTQIGCPGYVAPTVGPTPDPSASANPQINTAGLTFDPLTVGTAATQILDLSPYLNTDAGGFYITDVQGLPNGVLASVNATTLTLSGSPTIAGSGVATVTFSDGNGGVLGGDSSIAWTVTQAAGPFSAGCADNYFYSSFGFEIGPRNMYASDCVSNWNWTGGGKIYSLDMPAGLTLVQNNVDQGSALGYSPAFNEPTATVDGVPVASGTGTFHIIIESPYLMATIPVTYTFINYDSVWVNPVLEARDPYSISYFELAPSQLHMVVFENGTPIRVLQLPGQSGNVDSATLDLESVIDLYKDHSLVVRTYKANQFDAGNLPTLDSPYDATGSYKLLAKLSYMYSTATNNGPWTPFVYSTDAAPHVYYHGPTDKLGVIYVDGVATSIFVTSDGSDTTVPWNTYGDSTATHTVTWRTFDLPSTGDAPAFSDTSMLATHTEVAFVSDAGLTDLSIDPMTSGSDFTQTIDFATASHGFDFAGGGCVYATGPNIGLSFTVTNASQTGGSCTSAGAPVLKISGTPSKAGNYNLGLEVADTLYHRGDYYLPGSLRTTLPFSVVSPSTPTLQFSTERLTFGSSVVVTMHGPDGTYVCAYVAAAPYPVSCNTMNDGDTAEWTYSQLMHTSTYENPSSAFTDQSVYFHTFTPALVAGLVNGTDYYFSSPYSTESTITLAAAPQAWMDVVQLPEMQAGKYFEVTIDLSYYASNFDWSYGGYLQIDQSTLPDGLSWDYDSGWGGGPLLYIWGTPTKPGSGAISMTVHDFVAGVATTDVLWTAYGLTAPTIAPWTVNKFGSTSFPVADIATGFNWGAGGMARVTGLPTGLDYAVNDSWTEGYAPIVVISGTPDTEGTYTATLTVEDDYGHIASVDFTVTVVAVPVPTIELSQTSIGVGETTFATYRGPDSSYLCGFITAYTFPIGCYTVNNGDQVAFDYMTFMSMYGHRDQQLMYSEEPVSLHAFTQADLGVIGSYNVTSTDVHSAEANFTLQPRPPFEVSADLQMPQFQVGQPVDRSYDLGLLTTGFSWSCSIEAGFGDGTLPNGVYWDISNDLNGVPTLYVYGTPTDVSEGSAVIWIYENCSNSGIEVNRPWSVTAAPAVNAPMVDALTVGAPVDLSFNMATLATGFDWNAGGNASLTGLPDGLTYSVESAHYDGTAPVLHVTGTPTAAGISTVTMSVEDAFGRTATVDFTMTVNAAPTITLSPSSINLSIDQQTADITYVGPGSNDAALWCGATLLEHGTAANMVADTNWRQLMLVSADPTKDCAVSLRIYDRTSVYGSTVTADEPAVASMDVNFKGNNVTVDAIDLGSLKTGQTYDHTFDMSLYTTGFDFTSGGTVQLNGLPAGLQFEFVNANPEAHQMSVGVPQLRIFGTPTEAVSYETSMFVSDFIWGTGGQNATTSFSGDVALGTEPSNPPAKVITGPGTVDFTIPGLAGDATVAPDAYVAGVLSVTFADGVATMQVRPDFSGRIDQTVKVTQGGVTTTVHLVLTVRPLATTHNVFTLKSGKTTIHWTASPNAKSYKVTVNGHVVCSTKATSCTTNGLFGPKAVVKVIAYGADNLSNSASASFSSPTTMAPFGSVLFAADSAALTRSAKKTLHNFALVIAAQGFTKVSVNGYAAHWPSSISAKDKAYRIALTQKRAEAVRAYLVIEFKKLGVKVSVKTLGNGGSHPTVSGISSTTNAGNRRADISVS
jgi:outer membrane protein OmpA-like peptidoglycan-associated protein